MTASRPVSGLISRPTVEQATDSAIEANRPSEKLNQFDYEATPVVTDAEGVEAYPLHAGQLKAWSSVRRFVAIFAGWQSGKTVLGPWWMLREMQRKGPGDYAVIAPHAPMLKNKAKPELERVFKGMYHSSGDEWHINEVGAERIWGDRKAKGRILFRHAQAAEAIEAFTAKAIWVEEPGQIDDVVWKSIKPRGSVHRARYLLTSRPYEHNWYVREMWQACMGDNHLRRDDADPDIEIVNFKSTMNPAFPKEDYDREKLLLQPWEFVMKYDGIPERPAGLVYDCWEDQSETSEGNWVNLAKLLPRTGGLIPMEWPLWIGVDFGNINTAGVCVVEELKWDGLHGRYSDEPTGNYYLVATYHARGQKTAREHIRCMREVVDLAYEGGKSPRPRMIGGSHQEDGWRESYALSGVGVAEPTVNKVEVQISMLYSGLKTKKMRVSTICTNVVDDEVKKFTYELDDEGLPTQKLKDEHKFHRLAGWRYLATRLFRRADAPPGRGPKLGYGVRE